MFQGIFYKIRILPDDKFVLDVFPVVVDRMNADEKKLSDFFAGFPVSDQLENFTLPGGQGIFRQAALAAANAEGIIGQFLHHHRRKVAAPAPYGLDRMDQFAAGIFLDDVATGTGCQGFFKVFAAFMHAQKEDGYFRELFVDFLGGFDTPEFGHGNIENHHVRDRTFQ